MFLTVTCPPNCTGNASAYPSDDAEADVPPLPGGEGWGEGGPENIARHSVPFSNHCRQRATVEALWEVRTSPKNFDQSTPFRSINLVALLALLLGFAAEAFAASAPGTSPIVSSNAVPVPPSPNISASASAKTNPLPVAIQSLSAVTSAPPAAFEATVSRMLAEAMTKITNSPRESAAPAAVAPGIAGGEPLVPSAGPITNAVANPARALSTTNTLDDKLKLGIGDRLSYRVVEDLEDPKALVVTDSGDVEVPLVGRIPATDKTCKQLAGEIKAKLDEEYYYNATVVIAIDLFNRTRGKVYLVGYVRIPGPIDIPSDEFFTLGKAIMRAGGFSEYADKKRVRVTRKGSDSEPMGKNIEVDVGAVLEDGRGDKDIRLEVGDLIYVPSRLFKF